MPSTFYEKHPCLGVNDPLSRCAFGFCEIANQSTPLPAGAQRMSCTIMYNIHVIHLQLPRRPVTRARFPRHVRRFAKKPKTGPSPSRPPSDPGIGPTYGRHLQVFGQIDSLETWEIDTLRLRAPRSEGRSGWSAFLVRRRSMRTMGPTMGSKWLVDAYDHLFTCLPLNASTAYN